MRFASRKLFVTLLGMAAACVLAYLKCLDSPAATLIGGIVTAYLTANVGQKATSKVTSQ
jgi:hypothetical protein